jgi:hypothetical protein
LLPRRIALSFDRIRPYGFILLYALMLSGRLWWIVMPPSNFLLSWLT